MGVNLYLLDHRTAVLLIGGSNQTVGTLRRFFKLTELDADRAAERDAAGRIRPSPVAALVVDISELPVATDAGKSVPAHLVLGWDEGRGSVTDCGWDYLPTLGFAVRDRATGAYTLHEERSGLLYPIDENRARELLLVDAAGEMIRHGQPRITACRSVKPYISGYAEADCTLKDGRQERLLIGVTGEALPEPTWLVGKKPMEVERYPSRPHSGTAFPEPNP
jgi:hypothetical protein